MPEIGHRTKPDWHVNLTTSATNMLHVLSFYPVSGQSAWACVDIGAGMWTSLDGKCTTSAKLPAVTV